MEDLKVRIEARLFVLFIRLLRFTSNKPHIRRILYFLIYALSFNNHICMRNLKWIFPEHSDAQRKRIFKQFAFQSLKFFTDFLLVHKITLKNVKKRVVLHGKKQVARAFRKGNGAIFVSGHFGNFLLPFACSPLLIGKAGIALLDVECAPKLRKELVSLLVSKGNKVINRNKWRLAYNYLQYNCPLFLVADQALGNKSIIEVAFFGKKIKVPLGPVIISQKSGAPVIPSFAVFKEGKYHIYLEKPLCYDPTKSFDENARDISQRWIGMLEQYVRQYPSQYFWRLRL